MPVDAVALQGKGGGEELDQPQLGRLTHQALRQMGYIRFWIIQSLRQSEDVCYIPWHVGERAMKMQEFVLSEGTLVWNTELHVHAKSLWRTARPRII